MIEAAVRHGERAAARWSSKKGACNPIKQEVESRMFTGDLKIASRTVIREELAPFYPIFYLQGRLAEQHSR
jgi:hypothetical protein